MCFACPPAVTGRIRMKQLSSTLVLVGTFCEDIKEEGQGVSTLVKVLPDSVTLSSFPNILGSLAFYLRANVYRSFEARTISVVLRIAGQPDMPLTTLEAGLIRQAQAEAGREGLPFGTIVSTAIASDFPIANPGRVNAFAIVGDAEILCGTLKFDAPN